MREIILIFVLEMMNRLTFTFWKNFWTPRAICLAVSEDKDDDDHHPDVGDDGDEGGGEERWLIVKRGIRIMNKFPP